MRGLKLYQPYILGNKFFTPNWRNGNLTYDAGMLGFNAHDAHVAAASDGSVRAQLPPTIPSGGANDEDGHLFFVDTLNAAVTFHLGESVDQNSPG